MLFIETTVASRQLATLVWVLYDTTRPGQSGGCTTTEMLQQLTEKPTQRQQRLTINYPIV